MLIYLVLFRAPRRMKHTQRYTDRIMKRYRDDGLEVAVRYGCDLFGCQPAYCKAILDSLPLPLRVGIEKARTVAVEIRKTKNEQAQRAAAEAAEQDRQQQLEKERAAKKLLDDLDGARASGAAIRLLASLAPPVRDELATREEKKLVIALRKTAMMTARACAFVGCTKTELNKWDADGRLPHLFTRVIMRKKSVECRFWAEDTLEAAKELLSVWRQQDVVRKTKRTVRLVGRAA
jgi:hypothetical protein